MINQILANEAQQQIIMYVVFAIFIVLIIGMFVMSSRKNKKRQQEAEKLINSVKPGNKVKTIGGVCGIVVEVNEEENTFVLETGSETSGKCYMKFDKLAIYQTDAVVEDETKTEAPATDEVFAEEKTEEPVATEEPAETVETAEEKTEEKTEEVVAQKPKRAKKSTKKSADAE